MQYWSLIRVYQFFLNINFLIDIFILILILYCLFNFANIPALTGTVLYALTFTTEVEFSKNIAWISRHSAQKLRINKVEKPLVANRTVFFNCLNSLFGVWLTHRTAGCSMSHVDQPYQTKPFDHSSEWKWKFLITVPCGSSIPNQTLWSYIQMKVKVLDNYSMWLNHTKPNHPNESESFR